MIGGGLGVFSDLQRQAKFSAGHPSKTDSGWRGKWLSRKIESAKFKSDTNDICSAKYHPRGDRNAAVMASGDEIVDASSSTLLVSGACEFELRLVPI